MSNHKIVALSIFLLLAVFLFYGRCLATPTDPWIIWKWDDLRKNNWQHFKRVTDMVANAGGVSTVGIFSKELEGTDADTVALRNYVQGAIDRNEVEFWIHGYTGVSDTGENGKEFFQTPYSYQYQNFYAAINAMLLYCDFLMRTFQVHYHGEDLTTLGIWNANPYVKNWLWPKYYTQADDVVILEADKDVQIEAGTAFASYTLFYSNYFYAKASDPYVMLQGHPWGWEDNSSVVCPGDGLILDRWAEFAKMLAYLNSRSAKYTTAYGYWCIAKGINDTTAPAAPAGLNPVRINSTSARLDWTASVDSGSSIDAYKIYRNGSYIGISSSTFYVDNAGASLPDSTYYQVAGINQANLSSNRCASVSLSGAAVGSYTLTTSVNPSGTGTVVLNPTGGAYTAGTTVILTATANSGYAFSGWSGGASNSNNLTTVVVDLNKTVTANFIQLVTYTLTTSVSPSGAGSVFLVPIPVGVYAAGTNVLVCASANSGYTFMGWSGAASGTDSPVTIVMNANKSVTATFSGAAASYTLTTVITPTGGGTVALSPAGVPIGTYTAGTSVQLTATAASGYTFTSWLGAASGTSGPVTVTMDSNKTVTATFTYVPPGNYTLATAVSPSGGGTVALSPTGIPIGSYTAGTTVVLTATVATNYSFTSWTGSASGTTNPVTITIDANKTVTATFTYIPPLGNYTLTTVISSSGSGAVTLNPTGGVYTAGTSVQLTATAASGYTFISWTGAASGATNPVTVLVDADKTVTANFTANPINENPALSISPAGLDFGETELGTSKSLTFNITNTGTGTLSGSISTNQSWFTVNPLNFSSNRAITVTANTTGLVSGQTYTGTITITSNGGNASIAVTIVVATAGETTAEVTPSPNPFVLRQAQDEKLIFKGRGLTGTALYIYTLSGQLVRTIQREEGASEIDWDGTNENGEKVSGGIYLYVVISNDKKFTGRIAVIR